MKNYRMKDWLIFLASIVFSLVVLGYLFWCSDYWFIGEAILGIK